MKNCDHESKLPIFAAVIKGCNCSRALEMISLSPFAIINLFNIFLRFAVEKKGHLN